MKQLFLTVLLTLTASKWGQAQFSPCVRDTAFHFVVLGSSTAAGSGASTPDSAWVNRYRDHLQSIHPAYQVTNRAVGGFNTYRIMPTGHLPPANRPSPDTSHNITYAIALNPDAIIVNLPSNDVSSGFSVQEQLDNFDTIISRSLAAGIPIWVTTTQPKNYGGNQVNIQKQLDVRDSLLARYSPYVIDFWTGLADSSNQLAAFYDSGDGTHLNDAGHALVFGRAVDMDIPGAVYVPPPYTDYAAAEIADLFNPVCGDPQAMFGLVMFNRGLADSADVPFQVLVENLGNSQQFTHSDTLFGGLAQCGEDTLPFPLNTLQAGPYRITAVLTSPSDPNPANDTLVRYLAVQGTPQLSLLPDTGCGNSSLQLAAISDGQDSIRWWDAASAGNLVGSGPVFTTPVLSASTIYYAEALRGDFFYRNSLFTTANSNINYNGTMFDIVADSALVVDSISVKVADVGAQTIVFRTRPGSHLGYETNAAAWNAAGTAAVQVADPNVPVTAPTGGWTLNPGDTLGVYISMQNSGARLSYRNPGSPVTRSTPEMTMLTGSGIAFNFGGNYYPRDWNGTVYYHFGNRPDAECQSGRMPVGALISHVSADLGPDTILPLNASILLSPGGGYASYLWSNNSVSPGILLDGSQLGQGIYPVSVTVTDSLGCTATDEVIVVFAPLVAVHGPAGTEMKIWPNPAGETLRVALPEGHWQVELLDVRGKKIKGSAANCANGCEIELDLRNMPGGMYLLQARKEDAILHGRVLKAGH